MNWRARALATIYLALLPIAWPAMPGGIRTIDLLFPIFAIVVLWQVRWQRPRFTPLDYAVLVYLLAPLPSLFATPDLARSALVMLKMIYLATVYAVFAIYFGRAGFVDARRTILVSAAALSAAGLAAALVYYITGVQLTAMGIAWPLPYVGWVFRLWAATDSSEMLGNYLTFVLPLLCSLLLSGGATWSRAAMTLSILGAMCLSFAHAVAGFVCAGLVSVWPVLKAKLPPAARMAAIAAALGLVILVNLLLVVTVRKAEWSWDRDGAVPPPDYYYARQAEEGADRLNVHLSYNPMSYFLIKKIAIDAFRERPWAGAGVGSFHDLTERAYQDGKIHAPYRAIDPHSTVAGALAEQGLAGGVAVVLLIITALSSRSRSAQGDDALIALALRAAIIGLAINSINADVMHLRFLWVTLAALRAVA